jgi:hypothetical protein
VLRLESVEEIDCALGVGGGLKDRPIVILQNGQPGRDIRSMILTDLRRELKVCAKKRGTQLSNELLAGVAFIAPAFAAEVALNARRVFDPVRIMPISA